MTIALNININIKPITMKGTITVITYTYLNMGPIP